MEASTELRVGARKVKVTNLDRVLFPRTGFTKGQLIDYYVRISPFLLPHLKNRPVTMKRYPEGVQGEHFYEKHAPPYTPSWVRTTKVWRVSGESQINYILLNDVPSLVWSSNMSNIELHTFLARAPKIEQPTMLVFDLDPGKPAGVLECAVVALWLKDLAGELGLQCFVKSAGSKGLHCVIPLNTPVTYELTQPLAQAIAKLLERRHPQQVVSEMAKNLRAGKVLIDWSQNANYKSTVSVYSLRAKREEPYVSIPLEWAEIERALRRRDEKAFYLGPEEAIRRCEEKGDLFEPVLKLKQRLPKDWSDALRTMATSKGVSEIRVPKVKRSPKAKSPRAKPAARRAAKGDLSLDAYRAKRDFTQTREPPPARAASKPERGSRLFVIQKHAASHLHYDFRLEMGGALKSWAVPKGPPYERNEKRLAMQVEDHPLDYARFEGTIPPGNYGAGTVMVWDIGTYEVMDGNVHAGKLHLRLKGKKLKGEWILVRAARDEEKRSWFLIKGGTSMPRVSARRDDSSALTGRSLKQIAHANDAQWESNRPAARSVASAPVRTTAASAVAEASDVLETPDVRRLLKEAPRAAPAFVPPMQPKITNELPNGTGWSYEIKFDGYRAIAIKRGEKVELRSRNNRKLDYQQVADALRAAPLQSAVLDGEVVALDSEGKPSFQALQGESRDRRLHYYVFDLLNWNGRDLRKLPLESRRELLARLVEQLSDPVHFSAGLRPESATELIEAIRKQGLEGVVAKRLDSKYESGERSGAWVKLRTECEQEFVVGGFRQGHNANDFDALIVGYYEHGQLQYAGKVKDGFTPRIKRLLLSAARKRKRKTTPFAELPVGQGGRWGEGLTEEDLHRMTWLKPELVVQVRFVEWTRNGMLRHPSYKGLRDDKRADEVVRESE